MEQTEKTTGLSKKRPTKKDRTGHKDLHTQTVTLIDSSLYFTLSTKDDTPFNCALSVKIKVQNTEEHPYQSRIDVFNLITTNQVYFAVPFWEAAEPFPYMLTVTFKPQDGTPPYSVGFRGKITCPNFMNDNITAKAVSLKVVDPKVEFNLQEDGNKNYFFHECTIDVTGSVTWKNTTYTLPPTKQPISGVSPQVTIPITDLGFNPQKDDSITCCIKVLSTTSSSQGTSFSPVLIHGTVNYNDPGTNVEPII